MPRSNPSITTYIATAKAMMQRPDDGEVDHDLTLAPAKAGASLRGP